MALMVSVSGVRGLIGQTLTPTVAAEFAQAYGTLLVAAKKNASGTDAGERQKTLLKSGSASALSSTGMPRVVLARDTRPSGEMFAAAAAAGLLAAGCEVTQLGVVMTPTAGRAIVDGGYDGGVIITASHNPPIWNGMKFLDRQGLAPDPKLAGDIARVKENGRQYVSAGFQPMQHDDGAGRRHVSAVLATFVGDRKPLRGLKVVLDSVNGAGCVDGAALLRELGCELIHLNGEPTGDFAHTPEPIAENLTQLCDEVRRHKAAVGFAQDPDADRLAIVDENGTYIGEEYTLALACEARLAQVAGGGTHRAGGESPLLKSSGTRKESPGATALEQCSSSGGGLSVAANLSTSRLIDAVAARCGARVIRTAVGEANVARGMAAAGCVIGGEGNGGVIDPRITLVRDSLSAMSLVLQSMAATGKSLSGLVAGLPRLSMIKTKFECDRQRIAAAVDRVAAAFAGEKVDRSDGTRVDFAEGWVHLRASNTEPIVRIIAEGDSDEAARRLIDKVRAASGL